MGGRSAQAAARSPQRVRTGRACAGRTRRERKGRRSPGLDRVTAASSISNCPNLPFRRFLHLHLRATETEFAAALSAAVHTGVFTILCRPRPRQPPSPAIALRRSSGSESSRGRLDVHGAAVRAVGRIAMAVCDHEQWHP
jgi:hypothetical protein